MSKVYFDNCPIIVLCLKLTQVVMLMYMYLCKIMSELYFDNCPIIVHCLKKKSLPNVNVHVFVHNNKN
jgi:hypothetical protein